jgi:type II secretory ATPase GspE/PulE/Tfp pilus assembly ATPase PilB-like protein
MSAPAVNAPVAAGAARDVLSRYAPLPEGDEQYPAAFIEAQGAIKLAEGPERVTVGVTGKVTALTRNLLRNYHGKVIEYVPLEGSELSAWLSAKMGEAAGARSPQAGGTGDGSLSLDRLANDAPVINLVNSICIEGIRSGASDIHLEAGPSGVRVRCRIDGALRTVRTIPGERFPAVSSRIKIMANLNILERRQPQDGRITVTVGDERVELRVSIVPVTGGESIVLRILGKRAAAALGELGFGEEQLSLLRSLLRLPHGLILVTGPTGSGKTTTLNAMLEAIASDTVKIITIEDPVEFIVPGVNQIQTNEAIGLSFGTLLRRVLRQDPNVILIGEIRDGPTAEIALRSALTGHLVLSTLHTNDAASVIPRLINMGLEPYLVASVLKGAAAQRLVRKLCPRCKTARPAEAGERRILRLAGIEARQLWHSSGCAECGGTGFAGRTVIAEAFAPDQALEESIMKSWNITSITALLRERGMRSLLHDGLMKAAGGITTIAEVEREVLIPEAEA